MTISPTARIAALRVVQQLEVERALVLRVEAWPMGGARVKYC